MNETCSVDQCRTAFAEAFEAYAQEGSKMRDLLLSLDRSSNTAKHQSVAEQQVRLNEARRRYEEARSRYVDHVLKGYVNPGDEWPAA